MTFLLDTNVVSEIRKARPEPSVAAWTSSVVREELHLSVLVLGEVRRGVERLRPRDPVQAVVYERWLDVLAAEYGERILPITREIADDWGHIAVDRALPPIDGLLAATARVHQLTLVTRNVSHFAGVAVTVLNPFSS